jgi:hypothetical protein
VVLLARPLLAASLLLLFAAPASQAATRSFSGSVRADGTLTAQLTGLDASRVGASTLRRAGRQVSLSHRAVSSAAGRQLRVGLSPRQRRALRCLTGCHGLKLTVIVKAPAKKTSPAGSLAPGQPVLPGSSVPPLPDGGAHTDVCLPGILETAMRYPTACWRPYSDASPWNRVIPANPPLLSNSTGIVNRLTGWGTPDHLVANGYYNHPIYWAKITDPLYRVHCLESWGRCDGEGELIHIPAGAQPATPSWDTPADAHMAVIQPDGMEYDFWRTRPLPVGGGTITSDWGGKGRIDGNGLGMDATAGRFGLAAGLIRAQELAAGEIRHALTMVVRCDAHSSVYPTLDHVGFACDDKTNAPPMGARFQLDLTDAQIDALPVAAWKKTVFRAMAHYGMIVGDTGGGAWGIKIEARETYTSFGLAEPLVDFAKQNGWSAYDDPDLRRQVWVGKLKNDIDWVAHLRVVHPCVSSASC